MEQIVIQIKDKKKARMLFDLLTALDSVDSMNTTSEDFKETTTAQTDTSNFFAMAGLWEGRDVSLETIRQKTWPKESSPSWSD
jgi:hypothetical protein